MDALVFNKELHVQTVPQPTPNLGEALLKIRYAGICNTDMELVRGYKGFCGILGHEFVADVIAGSDEWLGKRVVGEINIACGECDFCLRDIPSQCRNRVAIGIHGHDGAFAEYMTLPEKNLYLVPNSISDKQAVFTEPLAAACQVLESVHISPHDKVIVIGAGKLGLLCAQVIKLIGADLSVIVRHQKQRELLQKWGIPAVNRDELPDSMAQVVVDCTGVAEGFAESLSLVEARGTILLKSTYEGLPQADLTRIAVEEIRVIGSRCGSFKSALSLMSNGLVDVKSMIDAEYSLKDGLQAFDYARQKGMLKVLLKP